MPKNTANTTAAPSTTAAEPKVGRLTRANKSAQPAATMKKEDTTMKKNPSNTPAITSPMSAQEFKQQSYNGYLVYVAFIEGNKSIDETVEALSPLMTAYGYALTADNLANTLTVKMTAFGKDKGEVAKKVKSIATFRAFVKGGWQDVSAAPVHSNAGKNPADIKPTAKAKSPTKADLEAKIAMLEAQLAANKPTESAPAADEVKAA